MNPGALMEVVMPDENTKRQPDRYAGMLTYLSIWLEG